jgi:hypothetical protein
MLFLFLKNIQGFKQFVLSVCVVQKKKIKLFLFNHASYNEFSKFVYFRACHVQYDFIIQLYVVLVN